MFNWNWLCGQHFQHDSGMRFCYFAIIEHNWFLINQAYFEQYLYEIIPMVIEKKSLNCCQLFFSILLLSPLEVEHCPLEPFLLKNAAQSIVKIINPFNSSWEDENMNSLDNNANPCQHQFWSDKLTFNHN